MVQDSAVKAIQCTSGVSNEYQKLLGLPLLAPAFSAMAWKRRENCRKAPPPCVPYASWLRGVGRKVKRG
jgi:hypothetical protein